MYNLFDASNTSSSGFDHPTGQGDQTPKNISSAELQQSFVSPSQQQQRSQYPFSSGSLSASHAQQQRQHFMDPWSTSSVDSVPNLSMDFASPIAAAGASLSARSHRLGPNEMDFMSGYMGSDSIPSLSLPSGVMRRTPSGDLADNRSFDYLQGTAADEAAASYSSDSLSRSGATGSSEYDIWSPSRGRGGGNQSVHFDESQQYASHHTVRGGPAFHHHPGPERRTMGEAVVGAETVSSHLPQHRQMAPPPYRRAMISPTAHDKQHHTGGPMSHQKMAHRFNVSAPEFVPSMPRSRGANASTIEDHPDSTFGVTETFNNISISSQPSKRTATPPRMRRHSMSHVETNKTPIGEQYYTEGRRHMRARPVQESGIHIAPPSELSETNSTRDGPIMIQPSGGMSSTATRKYQRGTSSRQVKSSSQSRSEHLMKTIYHKLITCQSGECRRRHSCIECLSCNSLFCETCSNISLNALTLLDSGNGAAGTSGRHSNTSSDADDFGAPWEFLAASGGDGFFSTPGDLHQIPGFCPSCDKQEVFSINLALMKILMKNEEYQKFAAIMNSSAGGGDGKHMEREYSRGMRRVASSEGRFGAESHRDISTSESHRSKSKSGKKMRQQNGSSSNGNKSGKSSGGGGGSYHHVHRGATSAGRHSND